MVAIVQQHTTISGDFDSPISITYVGTGANRAIIAIFSVRSQATGGTELTACTLNGVAGELIYAPAKISQGGFAIVYWTDAQHPGAGSFDIACSWDQNIDQGNALVLYELSDAPQTSAGLTNVVAEVAGSVVANTPYSFSSVLSNSQNDLAIPYLAAVEGSFFDPTISNASANMSNQTFMDATRAMLYTWEDLAVDTNSETYSGDYNHGRADRTPSILYVGVLGIDSTVTPSFSIDSVSNDSPTPGTSVTVTVLNGTAPYTATLNGKTITPTSQGANSFTFDAPDPLLFDDKTLLFNTVYSLQLTDADSAQSSANFSITPVGQFTQLSGMPAPSTSIVAGSGAVDGDYFYAVWTSGGNSQTFPSDGDTDGLDLPVGTHVVDAWVYSDHDSNATPYWSTSATWTINSASPTLALGTAVIQSTGNSMLLTFNTAVDFGAGGNAGFALTLSGGAVTATYASGAGTTQLVYNLSRNVKSSETGTLDYTQPTDGVEDAVTGADLASIVAFDLTNNSTSVPVIPTITNQPVNLSVADGQAFTFEVVATTGGLADPIQYQWYDASTNTAISGATNSTYSGTATSALNGRQYYCRLTSSEGGAINTNTVTLTVTSSSKRLVTQQLVDRTTSPATVLANTLFNYRVKNAVGTTVATGSGTSDNSGILTLDDTGFGSIGETVYLEILLASNSYAGFELTVQATP